MNSASENPEWLNYHHLRHFWMIAKHHGMTRAAEKLNISQSTLSEQLAELEAWLGEALFERRGRQLQLTDAGRVALEYAETIFTTGHELLTRFRQLGETRRRVLRIGAVGPLSKNLQFDFIQPILADRETRLVVAAGALEELILQLQDHKVDLVLSNLPMRSGGKRRSSTTCWARCRSIWSAAKSSGCPRAGSPDFSRVCRCSCPLHKAMCGGILM